MSETKSPLFEIKNLVASYDGTIEGKVLDIKELTIPKGEIIFLLGASGTGKSTLLEALGLMNNTLASGEINLNSPEDGKIIYSRLWSNSTTGELARIRKSFFSFIFQSTNLMENFTAYENICLSSMIQRNVNQSEALDGAKELMDKIGLPEKQVSTTTLAKNLSGGQRQRVAFVRALNSQPVVLFGDEPTGNLDENNANELMKVIRENLDTNSSAVIVSHDIRLALAHADRIIVLTKDSDEECSTVREENVFKRPQWESLGAADLMNFSQKIKDFYTVNLGGTPSNGGNKNSNEQSTKINYRKLFAKKEGRALIGAGYSNLLRLIAILSITFLAIGFANGSLNYLKQKLDDPFVNWLTITIPSSKMDGISSLLTQINTDEVKKKYNIGSVVAFTQKPLFFFRGDLSESQIASGRSVAVDEDGIDPIVYDILSKRNVISGTTEGFSTKDLSVIVTAKFLNEMGYDKNTPTLYLDFAVRDTDSTFKSLEVPIGIKAIVKEMPGKVDVAYSEYFIAAYLSLVEGPFDIRNKNQLKLLVLSDSVETREVLKGVKEYLKSGDNSFKKYSPEASNYNISSATHLEAYEVDVDFFPSPGSPEIITDLFNELKKSPQLKTYSDKIVRYYDYHLFDGRLDHRMQYDVISANFQNLDKVRDFGRYMSSEYNEAEDVRDGTVIEADLAKIREKENFNFLSTVAYAISLLVVIVGIISVTMFINNLLKTHLSKIQMNIGTFKAFGLGDKEAQTIYFFIILRFIFTSLISAFVLSLIGGLFIEKIISIYFVFEENVSYFRLHDVFTLISIAVVVITGVLVSWLTITRMLNKSPGDLIYNR